MMSANMPTKQGLYDPDDAFVVKFDPDGNREWVRQLGVPAVADRGYAIATDPTGNIYVTGETESRDLQATPVGGKRNPRTAPTIRPPRCPVQLMPGTTKVKIRRNTR